MGFNKIAIVWQLCYYVLISNKKWKNIICFVKNLFWVNIAFNTVLNEWYLLYNSIIAHWMKKYLLVV